jgi:hypothetical protein
MRRFLAKTFFALLVLSISSIHGVHIEGDEDTPPKVVTTTGFVPKGSKLLERI